MNILTHKVIKITTLCIFTLITSISQAQTNITDKELKGINNGTAVDPGNINIQNSNQSVDNCWISVSEKYKIPTYLLFAIAMVESGLNPTAVNKNTNGSFDYGYMQINNTWYPTLEKYKIKKEDLAKPCVSIQVGAWILAYNFYNMGYNWKAIGAYNARDPYKRWLYAQKVYAMHDMLVEWSKAYEDAYTKQYGVKPPHAIKPPENWVQYARKKADLVISKNKPNLN